MKYKKFRRDELKFVYRIYEDGTIVNDEKGTEVKPYCDKRVEERPDESPTLYCPGKDGKRRSFHFDEVVAEAWFPDYTPDCHIYFKDGNAKNCAVSNLLIYTPMKYIREVLHNDRKWKKVDVGEPLFYDYYISEDGELFNGTTYELVKPFKDSRDGHYRFTLYLDKTMAAKNKSLKKKTQQKPKHFSVNRVVARAFLGVPQTEEKVELVYYRDGNPENNHYTNLSWGDRMDRVNAILTRNGKRVPITENLVIPYFGEEQWRTINVDFVPLYDVQVSNFGRLRDMTNRVEMIPFKGAINANNQSWLHVSISEKCGGARSIPVHQLVARTFVSNPQKKCYRVVNHKNGNPECNWAINLEWCTDSMNAVHAFETNLSRNLDYSIDREHPSWRPLNIMAWSYGIESELDRAYTLYENYMLYFDDDLELLSKEEYKNFCIQHQLEDADFRKLLTFYRENYKLH